MKLLVPVNWKHPGSKEPRFLMGKFQCKTTDDLWHEWVCGHSRGFAVCLQQ